MISHLRLQIVTFWAAAGARGAIAALACCGAGAGEAQDDVAQRGACPVQLHRARARPGEA
jgi:hypothetical protein